MTNCKTKTLNFANQVFYIGIDTHKTNWKVSIRTNQLLLKEFSMDPVPAKLYEYMHRNYPGGSYQSTYEAGFCGFWIHRELTQLGFKNIIINPADVPTTHKEKDRKCDSIDSGKLARELENHSLEGIFIPNPQQEAVRSLAHMWEQYSQRGAQVKNRIKSLLHFTGVPLPEEYEKSDWSNNYMTMISRLHFEEKINRELLDIHIDELKSIRTKRKLLLDKIRAFSRGNLTIKMLRTVPGIGKIVAFFLYAELVDIRRFKGLDDLLSFIGLVPSTASSDDKEIVRGLSNRHNKHLRYLLIEAAWIAARKDPAMTAVYSELTKRLKKQKAILRIAKKLVNRIRFVWLHQKPYIPAIVA
jgi:transposase